MNQTCPPLPFRRRCVVLALLVAGWGGIAETSAQGPAARQSPGRQAAEDRAFQRRQAAGQTKKAGPGFSGVALSDQKLDAVRVEGNATIPEHVILSRVGTQAGRFAYDQQIRDDVRSLWNTRWFESVEPLFRDDGRVLVFVVRERPVVGKVQFLGNTAIKTKRLAAECGLEAGRSAYDPSANRECARRIEKLYREKGFRDVTVTLQSGDQPSQRDVIFRINEGKKILVSGFEFVGNRFVRDSVLKLQLETQRHYFWIGGRFDPETVPRDQAALEQYYQALGFFDVTVTPQVLKNRDGDRVTLQYRIKEGVRSKVRSVRFEGNQVLSDRILAAELELKPGQPFLQRHLSADLRMLKDKYDNLGRAFARVEPRPEFSERAGVVDLVYEIDEDEVKYVGDIRIRIRGDAPHTRESVARHQVTRFLVPGELFRAQDLQRVQASLNGSRLWDRQDPAAVNVRPVDGTDYRYGQQARGQQTDTLTQTASLDHFYSALSGPPADDFTSPVKPADGDDDAASPRRVMRPGIPAGHSIAPKVMPLETGLGPAPPRTASVSAAVAPSASTPPGPRPARLAFDRHQAKQARYDTLIDGFADLAMAYMNQPAKAFATGPIGDDGYVVRGQSPAASVQTAGYRPLSPPGYPAVVPTQYSVPTPQPIDPFAPAPVAPAPLVPLDPALRGQSFGPRGQLNPQDYLRDVSPQGDPFGTGLNSPGFVDVDIDLSEAQTGRFMFGAGVNSDAGVVGQVSLEENNFDLFRPPRSWADFTNGRAFRGGGQSFRIEAVPGSQVSRYLVSWEDPFFLDTDFSFGLSGYYYQRFFEDWEEERLGGRVTLGRLLSRNLSISSSIRLESVGIDGVAPTDPAILQAAEGDNFLSTIRGGLRYDTRDAALLPTTGYMIEGNYEQGFGDFVYPRFDLTGQRYWTVYQRPDGLGKHTLRLSGQFGYTGDDTPIFERYFAGGFQTFRGFDFRGVSPQIGGVNVGGQFLNLGTIEYMLPITANDNFKAVVFSDFGTVDESVSYDNFRVTAGFGFRVSIAAMGPAPLAFDFAFPILSQEFDDERVFSFYIGYAP